MSFFALEMAIDFLIDTSIVGLIQAKIQVLSFQ